MARWLIVYHDGNGVKNAVVEDNGGNLPYGVGELHNRIARDTDFDVTAVVELPEGFTPMIVVDGTEVSPLLVVIDA